MDSFAVILSIHSPKRVLTLSQDWGASSEAQLSDVRMAWIIASNPTKDFPSSRLNPCPQPTLCMICLGAKGTKGAPPGKPWELETLDTLETLAATPIQRMQNAKPVWRPPWMQAPASAVWDWLSEIARRVLCKCANKAWAVQFGFGAPSANCLMKAGSFDQLAMNSKTGSLRFCFWIIAALKARSTSMSTGSKLLTKFNLPNSRSSCKAHGRSSASHPRHNPE